VPWLTSLYEGLGLPVLKAMACGAIVVASATTATPEAAGNAAVLVDPSDDDAIVHGLRRALVG
jgi:glycosyltransferase involved in cell wall biosynthesis